MKLIIQIPCFNEEKTLPLVINSIPKKIDGVDEIETLIIDDGSADNTISVAKKLGVTHVVAHTQNKGLAHAFASGVNACLHLGADIIVNTDADNQYPQKDIAKLIRPILDNEADMVIADRQTDTIEHFSPLKKKLQKLGSTMVRYFSGATVPDAVSGFRAYTRRAAMRLNIVTDFSYAIETIIQAKYKRLALASVPIVTNPPTRRSRLFKNMFQHIRMSTAAMIRIYTMYQPFRVFLIFGSIFMIFGFLVGLRFLFYWANGLGGGHIQSLILAAILSMVGFQIFTTGIVADLIGINRKLLEDGLLKLKKIELEGMKDPNVTLWRPALRKKIKSNGHKKSPDTHKEERDIHEQYRYRPNLSV